MPKKKVPFNKKERYMTTCIHCTKTCHRYCYIKDDDNKSRCICIKNDYCTVCKDKCHWTEHKNRNYEIIDYMDDEIITFEFLKNKYYDNKNKLDYKTQMLNGAKNDLIKLYINST